MDRNRGKAGRISFPSSGSAAIALFYVPSAVVVIHLNNEMPLEGGLYQWAKLRFNEMTGFLVAWNMWIYAIVFVSEMGLLVTNNLAYALGPSGAWLADSKLAIDVRQCGGDRRSGAGSQGAGWRSASGCMALRAS